MVNQNGQDSSEVERTLLAGLVTEEISREEILKLIAELPGTLRFTMPDAWAALVRSQSLEDWRRLEAYKLLLGRCLSYPCNFDAFVEQALVAPGADKSAAIDMTMGQYVPVERNEGERILMVHLPIITSVGTVAVYFAVRQSTDTVVQAAVYPERIEG